MIKDILPLFSDVQIHNYKQFAKGNDRLFHTLDVLDRVWEYAYQVESNFILFSGDWFDSQGSLPTIVVNETIAKLQELREKYPKIICIAITGNHDQASKNLLHSPAVSALRHLERVLPKNFMCIDNSVVEIPNSDIVVFGIPYYEYPEHFRKMLEKQSKEASHSDFKGKKKLLMIHQTPTGLGNPNIPFDTDVNDPLYDVFDAVYDGHIHKRQQITPKFLVVGSPLHRTLEDEGQEKGFIGIHTDDITKWDLVSTRGLYPEFQQLKVRHDDQIPKDTGNYIIPQYEVSKEQAEEGDATVEEFGSDLTAVELMTNYWKEVDGKDEELLKIGLTFIK